MGYEPLRTAHSLWRGKGFIMGNKRNNNRKNNRHSDTLAVKLYNLIIDNDEIREVCNKFIDIDDLFDFAEENWCDEGDTDVDVIKDIMEDNTMLRGFSVRKFLPVIEAWLNDNFDYHDGEFYPIIEDIISLTSNANQSTLVAYEEVTRICSNIMNDYDMEFTTEVGVLGIIHAVKACINHIKTVGDKERGDSYTAASSSTKESEKEEEEVKEEVVEESEKPETKEEDTSKESEDNASKVDAEELKDKIDVESIAQNIYSEAITSGKLEEIILQGIIEVIRYAVDIGDISINTEKKFMDSIPSKFENIKNVGDIIQNILGLVFDNIPDDDILAIINCCKEAVKYNTGENVDDILKSFRDKYMR